MTALFRGVFLSKNTNNCTSTKLPRIVAVLPYSITS